MTKPTKVRRTKTIAIRLTREEHKRMIVEATIAGLELSVWVRERATASLPREAS